MNAMDYNNKGTIDATNGNFTSAISNYTEAMKLGLNDAQIYCSRGNCYHNVKNNIKAIQDWEKALSINPSLQEARENLQAIREDINSDIEWEKREKKILLVCSAVCCGLGTIIGIVVGIRGIEVFSSVFAGLWVGTGIGGAISYFPTIPYVFKDTMKEEGFGAALKTILIGILIWVFVFGFIGPIGLLVRVLIRNQKIKKLEKCLNNLGQQ